MLFTKCYRGNSENRTDPEFQFLVAGAGQVLYRTPRDWHHKKIFEISIRPFLLLVAPGRTFYAIKTGITGHS